jgi:hypothetical protein
MKEETAVEFLFRILYNKDTINDYRIRVFEQAKEMEEQQIKDAYQTSHISMMTAEQYYNETFKK